MGYYLIKFVSEEYTLRYDTTCDRQIISAGELVVKVQYLSCVKEKTYCYWGQKRHQQSIIAPTRTLLHPFLDVLAGKYFHGIPKSICNIKQSKQALQKHTICLTNSYHDYILEETEK